MGDKGNDADPLDTQMFEAMTTGLPVVTTNIHSTVKAFGIGAMVF